MFITPNGDLRFCDLPELSTAYKACGHKYGPAHELTEGLGQLLGCLVTSEEVPQWEVVVDYTVLVIDALGHLRDVEGIDPWQHAQANHMLTLVTDPTDSLQ